MGDELRGENLVHLSVRFSTEKELKQFQDLLYEKSGQGVSFTGLLEAMVSEVTIVTAVHNINIDSSRTMPFPVFLRCANVYNLNIPRAYNLVELINTQ